MEYQPVRSMGCELGKQLAGKYCGIVAANVSHKHDASTAGLIKKAKS